MFSEVESGRRAHALPRCLPPLYSTHVPSRMCSNSLKTNDGRHVYPSQNRGGGFLAFRLLRAEKSHSSFFAAPIRSKLPRESVAQESRSRWLSHRSR